MGIGNVGTNLSFQLKNPTLFVGVIFPPQLPSRLCLNACVTTVLDIAIVVQGWPTEEGGDVGYQGFI